MSLGERSRQAVRMSVAFAIYHKINYNQALVIVRKSNPVFYYIMFCLVFCGGIHLGGGGVLKGL